MFEKMEGIDISGMCFGNTVHHLSLFPNESQRLSIIFGKNGSGKSTIAKALKNYSQNCYSGELSIELIDYRNSVMLSKSIGERYFGLREIIYVYNEEFVMNNVGIKEDGLDTIVLFGKQNKVDEKIKDLNDQIDDYNAKIAQTTTNLEKLKNDIKEMQKEIEKGLKKEWAVNDKNIRGNRTNTPVNISLIEELSSLQCTQTIGDLQKKYNELMKKYISLTTQKKDYPEIVNVIQYDEEQEKKLLALLRKKLDEITVSNEDKSILEKMQNDLNHTKDLKGLLMDSTSVCPFCYQTISGDYKETLIKIISIILNREVDDHTNELDSMIINLYSFDEKPYETLNLEQCTLIKKQLELVNKIVIKYNEAIEEKKKSIYVPVDIESLKLSKAVNILYELIEKISVLRKDYYKSFSDVDAIKEELIMLNKLIAKKNYESKIERFLIYVRRSEGDANTLEEYEKRLDDLHESIKKLEAQKRDVTVPLEYINSALEYVFFAKDRMKIEMKNGNYVIKCKGKEVRPIQISCGERNIIAICYFFSKIMEGLKEAELYTRESFVIIDDPISSFDYDNRIGILSYLKQQTSKILNNNKKSRIVYLSHDLYTVDSIYKFVSEIRDQLSENESGIPKMNNYCFFSSIIDYVLVPENTDNAMLVYSKLLKAVYEYASGKETKKYEYTIGNIMRRLLEAFSTFEYQKGISELSFHPTISESINTDKRHFFENLMYRLVLHEESHSKDHINSLDVDFYVHNTEEEKIKTAQYILCLIYALNPLHLKMRFISKGMDGCEDAIQNIKKWYDDISIK